MYELWAILLTGPVLATVVFLILLLRLIALKRGAGGSDPQRIEQARRPVIFSGVIALSFAALSAGIWWLLSAAVAHM